MYESEREREKVRKPISLINMRERGVQNRREKKLENVTVSCKTQNVEKNENQENKVFKKRANPCPIFFIFVLSELQLTDMHRYFRKTMPMLGFEPRISDVGSNRSANCATITALNIKQGS